MEDLKICKYCGKKDAYEDNICDPCWEILARTRYIDLKVLNKILVDNGLVVTKIKK